tara:strand:- start:350 stop:556 length:207 start_codon:yes stop_codon:yes gene_type:complete
MKDMSDDQCDPSLVENAMEHRFHARTSDISDSSDDRIKSRRKGTYFSPPPPMSKYRGLRRKEAPSSIN